MPITLATSRRRSWALLQQYESSRSTFAMTTKIHCTRTIIKINVHQQYFLGRKHPNKPQNQISSTRALDDCITKAYGSFHRCAATWDKTNVFSSVSRWELQSGHDTMSSLLLQKLRVVWWKRVFMMNILFAAAKTYTWFRALSGLANVWRVTRSLLVQNWKPVGARARRIF